jgi:hypothetical protein
MARHALLPVLGRGETLTGMMFLLGATAPARGPSSAARTLGGIQPGLPCPSLGVGRRTVGRGAEATGNTSVIQGTQPLVRVLKGGTPSPDGRGKSKKGVALTLFSGADVGTTYNRALKHFLA